MPSSKCPKCGALLEAEARFCGECGVKIETAAAAPRMPATPAPVTAPVKQPAKQMPQAPAQLPARVPQQTPPQYEPPAPLRGEIYVPSPPSPFMRPATQWGEHAPVVHSAPAVQNMHMQAAPPPPPQQQNVNVYLAPQPVFYGGGPPAASSTFAWITLLFYFLAWPVGALLNLIGLVTGPRRGCFAAMFFLIFLPTMAMTTLLIFLIATGTLEEWARQLEEAGR